MPELPEVETVKNSIWTAVQEKIIEKIEINHSGVIKNATAEAFLAYLLGEKILSIERRGKYMVFRLSHRKSMVVHLRMTGQLVTFAKKPPVLSHCHAIIHFAKGGFYYRDVRRFGGFWIGENELTLGCGIEKLGEEPLSSTFTGAYLYAKVHKKRVPIKSLLLDQSIVAGIGNIYGDEICFDAKIYPLTLGSELSLTDCEALVKSTQKVLSNAIAMRGTTFSDYRDGLGESGGFQDCLKVYQREGLPCRDCGTILEKTKCAGRSTTFCSNCQPHSKGVWVIGLTGGIASGKTLAADYLATLGAEIVDADIIAREIMDPKGTVIKKIAKTFGADFLLSDGSLNRPKAREEIFKDKKKIQLLNDITHPAIRRRVKSRIRNTSSKIIILVVPLLIEAKFYDICDEIWLLYTDEKKQMKRLIQRDNISAEAAKNIIDSQLPYEKKRGYASVVIDNNQRKSTMKKQIKEVYNDRKSIL